MNTKLVKTIREAIALAGLKDGMTISFHHHLRNGDYVLNLVMDEIAAMGIRNLTVNASALFDTHAPFLDHIKNHVVRKVQTNYISAGIGRQISAGLMDEPVEFRTHGGRPRDIALGITPIDVAFIAAPCSDRMGNCTGKYGRSACGSLGYAFPDAMYAKKVIVITDELAEYPLTGWSIPEIYVDYVVQIDAIGDPAGIVSGTTRMTRNPVALVMAQTAARVIQNSGLLRDGFSFQTGAGGATLATAMYLLKGTPFLYQGEEIGMTNCPFSDIGELRDVESLNLLRQAAESGRMDWAWRGVRSKGRDNARTPMQWDASPNGGFTGGAPWIMVNPNVQEINVAAALRDPDSVLHYYRALLALRRERDVLRYGDFSLLLHEHPQVFAYARTFEGQQIRIYCNFTDRDALLPEALCKEKVLLTNVNYEKTDVLLPYEAAVVMA